MSNNNCADLCTAAKCQELERRIEELETIINEHLIQKIPYAHGWEGDCNIFLSLTGTTLNAEIYIDNIGESSDSVELPFVTQADFDNHVGTLVNGNSSLAHTYVPEIDHNLSLAETNGQFTLTSRINLEGTPAEDSIVIPLNNFESNLVIDGTVTEKILLLSVADGNSQDTAEIPLPFVLQDDFDEHLRTDIPSAHDYNPLIDVNVEIQENTLSVDVAIDDSSDTGTTELQLDVFPSLNADLIENTLFIDVDINGNSDTTTVDLPFVTQNEFNSHKNDAIPDAHNFNSNVDVTLTWDEQDNLTVRVILEGIGEDESSVVIDMNLDEILNELGNVENKLTDIGESVTRENDQNQALLDDLKSQIDLKTGELQSAIESLLQDQISGSFEIGFSTPPKDDNDVITPIGYMEYQSSSTVSYNSLNEALSGLDQKLTALHQDICKSIELPFVLPNLLLKDCDNLGSIENLTTEEIKAVNQDQANRLTNALENTQYNFLIPQIEDLLNNPSLDFIPSNLITNIPFSQSTNFIDYLTNYQLLQNLKEICSNKSNTNKIYSILGGNYWDNANNLETPLTLRAESQLRAIGQQQYTEQEQDKAIPINNLIDLIKAYHSVPYHRSGFHRLPATLMESIIKPSLEDEESEPTVTIFDSLSFQEWVFRQFDAIFGQYPIKFDYKVNDENGNEVTQSIEIPNNAEALTQILGIVLGISEESDNTLNAVMRCLAETRSGANAAILAHDFARSNAEYLGYRGRERKREVDVSFTPGAKSLREALQPSKQKLIGWDFDDKETLVELIKKLLFSADIIKAAMYLPFDPKQDKITGDTIKETLEKKSAITR